MDDGSIVLKFNAKGGRVPEESYMPLLAVILLFPVSCTVSSPVALMTFDKVASRNEFQTGSAILWSLLALSIWAGIIYAYNHRRIKISGKVRIVPKISAYGIFKQDFESAQDFVVRSNHSLKYTTNIHYIAVITKHGEKHFTNYMPEENAANIVNEIYRYR